MPLAICVTEHACLFFAGHTYTSKAAFVSMSLQMGFPLRAPWKIYFYSEPLPWLWLSCALARAWPLSFHKPLYTCRGFLAAIVPLHCLKRSRMAAIHEGEIYFHTMPHHRQGYSSLRIRTSLSSPRPSNLPGTCREQDQTITHISFFHHS